MNGNVDRRFKNCWIPMTLVWLRRNILILLLCITLCISLSSAQQKSVGVAFRELAADVAQEFFQKSSAVGLSSISLSVEGTNLTSFVENAFIDGFLTRKIRASLGKASEKNVFDLNLLVLDQSVGFTDLESGGYERKIQLRVEARLVRMSDGSFEFLETFQRERTDTVDVKETWMVYGNHREKVGEEASFFSKLFTPIIVLTGTALIIYLFFTVRS